jgi:hypothetical protein
VNLTVRAIWTCDECKDYGAADTQEEAAAGAIAHAETRHGVREVNVVSQTWQTIRTGK